MRHSRQDSTTTFPHVSLFTKGDGSAKTVPVRCCFWRTCFGPFRSIAMTSFDRIYPGSKHFVRGGFWPNYVSQCCVCHFSLMVPKHLDSCSNFHKTKYLQGLYLDTMFLRSNCWFLPRPIHPMWNLGPKSLMLAGDIFLDALLYYQ